MYELFDMGNRQLKVEFRVNNLFYKYYVLKYMIERVKLFEIFEV